jgi:hypothetical protein
MTHFTRKQLMVVKRLYTPTGPRNPYLLCFLRTEVCRLTWHFDQAEDSVRREVLYCVLRRYRLILMKMELFLS